VECDATGLDALRWFSDIRLVDGALLGRGQRLEGKLAEGLLVLGEVVAEDIVESFGLLGAEVDALEVAKQYLLGSVLGHGAEDEEEVPDGHANLNTVGVAVAVVGGGGEFDIGLGGLEVRLVLRHEFYFQGGDEEFGAKEGT
jgi:hypothetical protein